MLKSLGRGLAPLKSGAVTDASMKGVVVSCVLDLDVTKSASYPGTGQWWHNLVTAPADGSAQNDYHFTLGTNDGAATNDPAFTGSAGSPSAYFNMDGGDYLRIPANTDFINALHKTTGGTAFWIAIAFRAVDSGATTVLGTRTGSGTSNGIALTLSSSERFNLSQGNGSAQVSTSTDTQTAVTPGTDSVVIYTYSGGSVRSWVNRLSKLEQNITFGATSSAAAGRLTLGATAADGSAVANNTRIYALSMGNAFIDDADAAKIFAAYESRHVRDYTP